MSGLLETVLVVSWIAGVAIAEGVMSTVAAVLFPPWAVYLTVERALVVAGWLAP